MNNIYTIRQANKDDQGIIRKLVIEGKINPTRLKWKRFVVAETENGIVIGCGQIKPHSDGTIELASIAVTKSWRNKSIAKDIIKHLLIGFEKKPIYLVCRSNLKSFYLPFGFVPLTDEQLPKYFQKLQKIAGFIKAVSNMDDSPLFMGRNFE
jgi:N-acetylglutamate synthase-like GNAT family acetyltransferase